MAPEHVAARLVGEHLDIPNHLPQGHPQPCAYHLLGNLEGEERQDFQSPRIPDPDHHGENQERGINLDRCGGEGLISPLSARIDLCFLVLSS